MTVTFSLSSLPALRAREMESPPSSFLPLLLFPAFHSLARAQRLLSSTLLAMLPRLTTLTTKTSSLLLARRSLSTGVVRSAGTRPSSFEPLTWNEPGVMMEMGLRADDRYETVKAKTIRLVQDKRWGEGRRKERRGE